MGEIYLDSHRATPPLKTSVQQMALCVEKYWRGGSEEEERVSVATVQILSFFGASAADRFHLFSSCAEAIEHLLLSYYLDSIRLSGKNHLLTLNTQEASTALAFKKMQELGCHVKLLEVSERGLLSAQTLQAALNPRVALFSFSLADLLTGMIQPIEEIVRVCHEAGVAVHVDVSGAVGKIPIAFEEWGVDFLTFDGSLCFAPGAVAGLIVKADAPFKMPRARVAVAGIASLLEALREVMAKMQNVQLDTAFLSSKLESALIAQVPRAQALFGRAHRLPNVVTLAFPGIHSQALLFLLEQKKVYASIGGGSCQRLSHLLLSLGVDPLLAHSAISFALSFQTTAEQIDQAIAAIVDSVNSLSPLSAHLPEGK